MAPIVLVVAVIVCIVAATFVPHTRPAPPPGVQLRRRLGAADRAANRATDRARNRATALAAPPACAPKWRTSTKRRLEPYVRHLFVRGSASYVTVPVNLKNVTGVELWKAWVPRGEHALHGRNNTLTITVARDNNDGGGDGGDTEHTVRVDEGE